MKGVVLSGGAGTRLRPITFSMAKQLVPTANKPILFYGLEDLASAGIREVGIVIAPETGAEIRAAVGDGSGFGLNVQFIVQERPLGLAHALRIALPFVGDDDCLMYLGDNLLKGGITDVVRDFEHYRPNCQIMLCEVEDPSAYGVAELDGAGEVVRLVEKPILPASNLALVGVYLFDQTASEAVEALTPSARGEYEITDAIQYLIDSGRRVRSSLVRGWWKDTGKKDDLLHANRLILSDLVDKVEGDVEDCQIMGPIQVGTGSRLVDSSIVGPAIIGEDTVLERTNVGPYTAIGDRCRLTDCAVEASVVMSDSEVSGWRLRNSLLGSRVVLRGGAPAGYVEVTLGERSEVLAP
jgi:glucose-1-phosphate thymidylyltransferase